MAKRKRVAAPSAPEDFYVAKKERKRKMSRAERVSVEKGLVRRSGRIKGAYSFEVCLNEECVNGWISKGVKCLSKCKAKRM